MKKIGDFILIKGFMTRVGLNWWFETPELPGDPNSPWCKVEAKQNQLYRNCHPRTQEIRAWNDNLKNATHTPPKTLH